MAVFVGSHANLMLLKICVSTGQTAWLVACPFFYLRDTTFHLLLVCFFNIPPPIWSVYCPSVFSILVSLSPCLESLIWWISICPLSLYPISPAHTQKHKCILMFSPTILNTEKSVRSTSNHLLIFQSKLQTVCVGDTRDSHRGFRFNPLLMFCLQLHVQCDV